MNTDNNTHEYYIHLKESESRMNTHEVRVSLETAKMLQKAGFDWECEYAFTPTTVMGDKAYRYNHGHSHNYNDKKTYPFEIYSAPTLDVAQRWLREVKGSNVDVISVQASDTKKLFIEYDVVIKKNGTLIWPDPYESLKVGVYPIDSHARTYEEAQEAGIQLTILLEEKK